MYAVVEIQGSQFKVKKDQKLFVNRINAKEGSKISFDNVLLIDDGKKVQVGKRGRVHFKPGRAMRNIVNESKKRFPIKEEGSVVRYIDHTREETEQV